MAVKKFNSETSHHTQCIGIEQRTKHGRSQWAHSYFKATEITVIKCGEAIKARVHFTTQCAELWMESEQLWSVFSCCEWKCVTATALKILILTCDHGPVVQTGGQLCVLQACLLAGVGCWAQWESARASASVWLVFWTHWTCRICSPPPQLRLHTPHSPTDQLGQHNTRTLNQHARLLNHLIQTGLRESTNDMITVQWQRLERTPCVVSGPLLLLHK